MAKTRGSEPRDGSSILPRAVMKKNLIISLILNIGIVISQLIGFVFTKSTALLGDAAHNFSDVLSITISLIFHKKDSKLAKWINISLLFILIVFLGYEAVDRFINPIEINSIVVILLAIVSIVFNYISVRLLHSHQSHAHMKATYIHLLSDVMTSVAVLVGGVIMYFTGFFILDGIILVGILAYIVKMTIDLL